jgi:protein-S-isoprenylcysteine O-methyltransferase Ste14
MNLNQRIMKLSPRKILLRIPVPWVFVITYLVGLLLQVLFPFSILSQNSLFFIKVIGIGIFGIGAFLASWSLIIFRKNRTTTTPGERSKRLILFGPYRFTRNPMYVSLTLAYLGEAGFLTHLWPVFVLPFVLAYVNWIVIPLEEDLLRKDFKEEYENYCAHVRRWI